MPVLNMIAHSNHAKMIAYSEGDVFMVTRELKCELRGMYGFNLRGTLFIQLRVCSYLSFSMIYNNILCSTNKCN